MSEIREFLERHLQGIFDGDVEHYKVTTSAWQQLQASFQSGRHTQPALLGVDRQRGSVCIVKD